MSRRADVRRTLICCQLSLTGRTPLPELATLLGRWRWTTLLDLSALQETGMVCADWVATEGWPAGRTEYRLRTDAEREEHDARVTEMRLRAALWAKAQTVNPENNHPERSQDRKAR